ncbi:GMC family oxidoreductase [Rhizobium sp. CC-YZS058]|uniref:GMC family oxidoreductase n=1 Tax=Rhizobium sp. CC-YZS058 TaxID=3042153 RepID=UPI002B05C275|nr:GMC family oxidoreductase N-terminal domain-containing protein [Rhizobium sp. CC-YZS058]MEA3535932.1 GMC family oxidoreductase N-terminal domain-containing protein [Rhizobium sp. CC-YZS058]
MTPPSHQTEKVAKTLDQDAARFDFIVCGAGSSGSVVAARLAECGGPRVLLLEAGGDAAADCVSEPGQWPLNLGSQRDWGFVGEPTRGLAGRRLPLNMGKGLGGGSSINVMVWARGHKQDWEHFAAEAGDAGWSYESVLGYYRRIEDWQGVPDPIRRGTGGPAHVEQPQTPQPVAHALLSAAAAAGIPVFDTPNGAMMEGEGGAAIAELRIKDGKRQTVYQSYVEPLEHKRNLTVITGAMVSRLLFEGKRVVGVEAIVDGQRRQFRASFETILSLGAIQTPKLLLQSGIGPSAMLSRHGIAVVEDLPGVGENHQDHLAFGCTWAYRKPESVGGSGCEATLYWKSDSRLTQPDILQCQLEFAVPSPVEAGLETPAQGWTMFAGLAQPKSRGRLQLSGPNVEDPLLIQPNSLSEPEDVEAAIAAVELCRELGNSAAFAPLVTGETAPGARDRRGLIDFLRRAGITFWHQSGTAKMGRDPLSVVDHQLKVHGIKGLRIADSSIMPRITTGNTMAPCVVIGERAADMIRAQHDL